MMTPEQLDNWFTYHPPTEETAPRYAAIRAAEESCHAVVAHAKAGRAYSVDERAVVTPAPGYLAGLVYADVNRTFRAFAEVIDANAPDSADKSAAIRCIRLARNCANEAASKGLTAEVFLWTQAHEQLRLARFQANSAIACGGK